MASRRRARTLDLLGVGEGAATVLSNGAAGGVGNAAVQLAAARGARVIGTASEHNHEYLRSLGAEPTTYGDQLTDRVREIAPDGVDAALDAAGGGALPALVELAGDPERVVTIADYAGAQGTGAHVQRWDRAPSARSIPSGRSARSLSPADSRSRCPDVPAREDRVGARAQQERARARQAGPRGRLAWRRGRGWPG